MVKQGFSEKNMQQSIKHCPKILKPEDGWEISFAKRLILLLAGFGSQNIPCFPTERPRRTETRGTAVTVDQVVIAHHPDPVEGARCCCIPVESFF